MVRKLFVSFGRAARAAATLCCVGCLSVPTTPETTAPHEEEVLETAEDVAGSADATDSNATDSNAYDAGATDAAASDAAGGDMAADAGAAADVAPSLDAADAGTTETSTDSTPDSATDGAADSPDAVDEAAAPAEDGGGKPDGGLVDSTTDTAGDAATPPTPDAVADAVADMAPDVAEDAVQDTATPLVYDPTNYTPVEGLPAADWTPPAGMFSSAEIGCDADAPGPGGKFVDVLTPSGIALDRPESWPDGYVMTGFQVQDGGGQALGDFNGDGRLDMYFPVETGDDWLYLGHPSGPWKFKGFPVQTKEARQNNVSVSAVG